MSKVQSKKSTVNADRVIILVMGETGSGKSRFINHAAGGQFALERDELAPVGRTDGYRVELEGKVYLLVESTGFNQEKKDDHLVLGEMIQWLDKNCAPSTQVGGIVYVHDISQNGNTQQYLPPRFWPLALLRKPELVRHLAIVTAKWDREGCQSQFSVREALLKDGAWQDIIQKGAEIRRIEDHSSAKSIITFLTDRGLQPLRLRELLKIFKSIDKEHKRSASPRGFLGRFASLFGFW